MNKDEFIRFVAERSEFPLFLTRRFMDATITSIKDIVLSGEKIYLRDFGTFYLNLRRGRIGRKVKTGDTVEIPPKYIPAFKPGEEFKRAAEKKHVPEWIYEEEENNDSD